MVLFMLCDPYSGYRLDTILDGNPGRAGRDVLPPPYSIVEHQNQRSYLKKIDAPSNVRLGIENVAACRGQQGAIRNVEQISAGDFLRR